MRYSIKRLEIVQKKHALKHALKGANRARKTLKIAGKETYERIIEVPLWEEFAKPLKSPIADLNNLGVREGQSTIAGKFLC